MERLGLGKNIRTLGLIEKGLAEWRAAGQKGERPITHRQVADWLAGYEGAWRASGTPSLGELFTDEASYRLAPYEEPITGIAAIAQMWETEREGPDEAFTMSSDIVAVEGNTAVARVAVTYGDPATQEYVDLWIIRFAADGRCSDFEEWPFWPGKSHVAASPP